MKIQNFCDSFFGAIKKKDEQGLCTAASRV